MEAKRYPYASSPGSAYLGAAKPIKALIAVAVSPEGTWNVAGYGGPDGPDPRDMTRAADDALDRVDTNHRGQCQVQWREIEIQAYHEPVSMGRVYEDKYHAAHDTADELAFEIEQYRIHGENPPEELIRAQRAAEEEAIEIRGMWEAYSE